MLEEDKKLLKSLSPVSDNVTDRYYPSGRAGVMIVTGMTGIIKLWTD